MSQTVKTEAPGPRMVFLVITILILIGASIGVRSVFYKEKVVHNPCDVPDWIISNPHANSTDLTQNNGFWDIAAMSMSCHRPKLADIEFTISDDGYPIWMSRTVKNATIEHSTSNYYWKVYSNGNVYFAQMGQRYPLVPDNYIYFDMDAATTAENATVIMYIAYAEPQYLGPSDTIFVFRDTNADGKNEITQGCSFELHDGRSSIASTILN